jgi:hypothetical protein
VLVPLALGAALWITPSAFVAGYLGALGMASLLGAVAIDDGAEGFVIINRAQSLLFQAQAASEWVALPTETSSQPTTDEEEVDSDDSIVQRMTRRRVADGGEVIEGEVRIDLDPRQVIGVAHLSFSPPLSCDPRAECHLLCDFDGRVRITVAKAYGLRIEARQSGEPTLATSITVGFAAEAPPAASRAAAA